MKHMDCTQARLILGPDPGPRTASPEVDAAFAHYEDCDACHALFANHRLVAERVRQAAGAQRAPDALRARIMTALEEESQRPPAVTPRRRWGMVAAALVAATVAGLFFTNGGVNTGDEIAPLVAQTFQPGEDSILITQAEPLRAWLTSHSVPDFDIPDIPNARIAGARLTTVDGVRSAVIDFVQNDGSAITYLMVPKAKIVDEMDAERILARTSSEYEVAMWQEDGTARALFADIPRERIMAIAELCKFKRAI